MGVSIQVTMSNNLDRLTAEILDGLRSGVGLAGERLLALSAVEAPFDLGTLVGTGAVSTPLGSRDSDPVAIVSYDTPYAARLHEHPEYQFQDGRKGKFLEDPAMQNKGELGDIIRKQVRGG